ncbi:MAG: PD40 domain-containing protein [Chloroflexia bacterium]|nr:PD40 domain-containing protein [Chloroflexia bacterium]
MAITFLPLLFLFILGLGAAGAYHLRQTNQAAAYSRGVTAQAAQDYLQAASAFADATGYRDAAARHAAVQVELGIYRAAYLDGLMALESGQYAAAISALEPIVRDLPGYKDAAPLLAQARSGWEAALLIEADRAEMTREWLAAERSLAALAELDPSDEIITARLKALRREHTPFLIGRDSGLYLVSPDLTDERLITDAVSVSWPVWSPDRTRIAFVSIELSTPDEASLYLIDTEGQDLELLATGVTPYRPPTWSPDGTRLVYTSLAGWDAPRNLGVINIAMIDLASRVVTDLTGNELTHANHAVWSPTGDRIAFVSKAASTVTGSGQGIRFGESSLYILTLRTGELTELAAGQLTDAWRVAWSPADDRLLIFSRHRSQGYNPDLTSIQLLDMASGNLTEMTPDPTDLWMPVWSPDGTRFAFVEGNRVLRIRDGGPGEVWVNLPTPISGMVSWSPDGSALIVTSTAEEHPSYLVALDDGGIQRTPLELPFTSDRYLGAPPQWSAVNPASPLSPPTVAGTALDSAAIAR